MNEQFDDERRFHKLGHRMKQERAIAIALEALTFLAGDPERLEAFMANTGLSSVDLTERTEEPDLLVSVLDAVLADETTVMLFAAERQVEPEMVYPARLTLGGTYDVSI
ncbi:MAG: DUF3572 domain-containing protein [Pseudomonadota bacterium]